MKDFDEKEAARIERNRYYREYRARHPEKTKAANDRYWQKRAAKANADNQVKPAEEGT